MFFFFGPIALIISVLLFFGLHSIKKFVGFAGVFWIFFAVTAFLNATVINTAYHDSDLDDWMVYVGPAVVFLPLAFLIYSMECRTRKPLVAGLIASFGALPVTALWLFASWYLMD